MSPAVKYVSLRYHGPQALIVELGREINDGEEFDAPEEMVDRLCAAHGVEVVRVGKSHPTEYNRQTAKGE